MDIRKIDDLARSNNWNDTTTYTNVANAFKGFARDWLFAMADMLDWTEAQLTWTNLKPRFQKQFAIQRMTNKSLMGFLRRYVIFPYVTIPNVIVPNVIIPKLRNNPETTSLPPAKLGLP